MLYIKSFVFSPIQENTYILYNDDKKCIIIDPGCYHPGEKEQLADYIMEMQLVPQMLLNTHCHLDHVFGNQFVSQKYGLTLQITKAEKPLLDYAPTSGLMYNLPFDSYQGDIEYLDGKEEIPFHGDNLKILPTPGHSPGSISFYNAESGFVISGDALFYRSIGRTDLPGGDHNLLLKSIREQLLVLPEKTLVYSGHGPVTTVGDEKMENPFLN